MIISTGKADWVREVTEEDGSLAQLLSKVTSDATDEPSPKSSGTSFPPSKPTTRVGIINSSHTSEDDDRHRVLILPDYKVVTHVPGDKDGAQELYRKAINPGVGRVGLGSVAGEDTMLSYPLPYACVILLCEYTRHCTWIGTDSNP